MKNNISMLLEKRIIKLQLHIHCLVTYQNHNRIYKTYFNQKLQIFRNYHQSFRFRLPLLSTIFVFNMQYLMNFV